MSTASRSRDPAMDPAKENTAGLPDTIKQHAKVAGATITAVTLAEARRTLAEAEERAAEAKERRIAAEQRLQREEELLAAQEALLAEAEAALWQGRAERLRAQLEQERAAAAERAATLQPTHGDCITMLACATGLQCYSDCLAVHDA